MKPNELMDEWYSGIRINVLAHYECAKIYERYHRGLGYPTVILSALTGTAFVSTLNDSSSSWIKGVAILLSLVVTVLASLQTFLRYSERSEKHKTAATEFGKLRRELEQMLVLLPPGGEMGKHEMDAIRTKWGELSANAPSIPNHVYARLQAHVAKGGRSVEKFNSGQRANRRKPKPTKTSPKNSEYEPFRSDVHPSTRFPVPQNPGAGGAR